MAPTQQQRVRNVVPKGPTPPKRQSRAPQNSQPSRTQYTQQVRQARGYGPTNVGKDVGSSVGTLEAEFFGAMLLIGLTIFFDPKASSDYSSVMLAAMKRGTLTIITFFLLALMSAAGPNAARFAKAFGALVIVALILAQAQNGMITKLDSFFKADWTSGGGATGTDSSGDAQAGTQSTVPGTTTGATVIQKTDDIGEEILKDAATVNPVLLPNKIANIIKGLIP
jgi:hypothetical protein